MLKGDFQKDVSEASARAARGEKGPRDPGMSLNVARVTIADRGGARAGAQRASIER